MAKAYLIGGVPRCGKTTIALKAVREYPMFATSTDSVRYALRGLFSANDNLALFNAQKIFEKTSQLDLCKAGKASEIVTVQNEEFEAVWPSIRRIIEGYIEEDLDILVEGVALLPHLVNELACEYSAIFVGNTSLSHGRYMLDHARSGSYDWMSSRSDEAILEFAKLTNLFSEYFAAEAKKYGRQFLDWGDSEYDNHIQRCVQKILT